LKDRTERRLELDDIRAYCRIVTALARTIELQKQINGLYPDAERAAVPLPAAEIETKTSSPSNGSTRRRPRRA